MATSLVSGLNPTYYERAQRGDIFVYTTPAQALVISATGGGAPTVINPPNSGVDFVPISIRASFVSGTTTIGGVLIARTLNAAAAATGAAVVTATLVDPLNAYAGGQTAKRGQTLWSPTTNSFTAAPTVIAATSMSFGTAEPTASGGCRVDDLAGGLVFGPGTAMSLVYSVTTSTALFFWTIIGIEIPVN